MRSGVLYVQPTTSPIAYRDSRSDASRMLTMTWARVIGSAGRRRGVLLAVVASTAVTVFAPDAAAQDPSVPGQAPNPAQYSSGAEYTTTPVVTGNRDVGVANPGLLDHSMVSVRKAFELQLGAGASLPLGDGIGDFLEAHPRIAELADAGGTLALTLGYRVDGHWMVGLYGSGSQFARGGLAPDGTNARSANGGIQGDYHFRPSYAIDPWISLGTGWRGFWLSGSRIETTSVQGLELVKFNVGLDFRITRDFALAPMLGSDVTLFLTKEGPRTNGFSNISDPPVNFFLFFGLQMRLNVGGSRPLPNYASATRPSSG